MCDAQPSGGAEELAECLRQVGQKPNLYQRDKTDIVNEQLIASDVGAAEPPEFAPLPIRPATGLDRAALIRFDASRPTFDLVASKLRGSHWDAEGLPFVDDRL